MGRAARRRPQPPLVVVGAGRLARALVPRLADAGVPVAAVVSRRPGSARALARRVGARAAAGAASAATPGACLLLAVPDDALDAVAREWADLVPVGGGARVALHHAGALGPEPLAPLAARGVATGVLHPLQSLGPGRGAGERLDGAAARIEGAPAAVAAARRLARAAGLRPLPAPGVWTAARRADYHAAAALAANDLVALFAAAVDRMAAAGVPRARARDGLVRLVEGALAGLAEAGPAGALTGPAARGDLRTLERHLARLAEAEPDVAEAHRLLSLKLIALARAEGRSIPASVERALRSHRPGGRPRRPPV